MCFQFHFWCLFSDFQGDSLRFGLYVHALRQAIHRNREESSEGIQRLFRGCSGGFHRNILFERVAHALADAFLHHHYLMRLVCVLYAS
jgi:hypothetical protein